MHFGAQHAEKSSHRHHVHDTGHIADHARAAAENRRRQDGQSRIFCSADLNLAAQLNAAGDDDFVHGHAPSTRPFDDDNSINAGLIRQDLCTAIHR